MDWTSCLDHGVPTISCISILFNNIVYAALTFGGLIAVIVIILSGYKMIFAGGDPKQLQTARNTLLYAVIGLLIIFLAAFIINIVAYLTGVNCINTFAFDSCK